MIVYAVQLEMDAGLRDAYLAWLHSHVRAMLALPGFVDADILAGIDPPSPPGRFVATVHYRLRDRAAWDAYLARDAERMRAEGTARFGTRVRAVRRVFEAP